MSGEGSKWQRSACDQGQLLFRRPAIAFQAPRCTLLSPSANCRRRDLAAAIWRPELGLAEVVLLRGKVLSHMGFTKGPKHYLFPEEAA